MKYTLADHKTAEGSILRKDRDTYIVITSSADMEGFITKLQVLNAKEHKVIEVDPSFVTDLEYIGNNDFMYELIDNARRLTHEHRLLQNGIGDRVALLNEYRALADKQRLLVNKLESGLITPTDYYKQLWLLTDKMVREYLILEEEK